MITKDTIRDALLENRGLLRQYGIQKLGLFGSHARGKASENSDIDLLVETEKGMDLIRIVELEMKLTDILGRKVDLVSIKGLNKYIGPFIMEEAEFVEGICLECCFYQNR